MLREIQKPRPGATLKTLGRLPDPELPELDEALAANFEAGADLEATGNFDHAGIRAELVTARRRRRLPIASSRARSTGSLAWSVGLSGRCWRVSEMLTFAGTHGIAIKQEP
jgi:hypothetical protein